MLSSEYRNSYSVSVGSPKLQINRPLFGLRRLRYSQSHSTSFRAGWFFTLLFTLQQEFDYWWRMSLITYHIKVNLYRNVTVPFCCNYTVCFTVNLSPWKWQILSYLKLMFCPNLSGRIWAFLGVKIVRVSALDDRPLLEKCAVLHFTIFILFMSLLVVGNFTTDHDAIYWS